MTPSASERIATMTALKTIAFGTFAVGWLLCAITLLPAALAAGFWFLGFPLDWSSWKTYAGLEVIALSMTFLTK